MTETLQQLGRRIASTEELNSVTSTMKGLAAVNVRHFQRAAQVMDRYQRTIERGIQIVLRDTSGADLRAAWSDPSGAAAVVVFGSNQGLCGPVNRHVVGHTREHLDDWLGDHQERLEHVVAVGDRLAAELEVADLPPTERFPLPSTLPGIGRRADELLVRLDQLLDDTPGIVIKLAYAHVAEGRASYEPVVDQLVPLDTDWLDSLRQRPWPTNQLPTYTMPRRDILSSLTRHLLYVRLHRSFAQTMAAVAASRMSAMESAQENVDERLQELRRRHHLVRQSQITGELLDVVSGFEVINT